MTDDPTPEGLEQLARSVAMSGVLGDRDRLAEIDNATRRHPSNRHRLGYVGYVVRQVSASQAASSTAPGPPSPIGLPATETTSSVTRLVTTLPMAPDPCERPVTAT